MDKLKKEFEGRIEFMKLFQERTQQKMEKEMGKMLLLLRRVYNVIEMKHLNDSLEGSQYYDNINNFPKGLAEDIFNYLSSKSETFRETAIKRQKRYRRIQKLKKLGKINPPLEQSCCVDLEE